MTPPVNPVESRSVPDLVTSELRRSIISGDLAPGETFSLRKIADMLNVSFIPVREALRNLEAERLVITAPGRSAVVTPLDLDDLNAIYRLRGRIEPEISGRSCQVISDDELDRLEKEAISFGDEYTDMQIFYDAHHEFHVALLAPAATEWDLRVLETLCRAAERYIRIGFKKLEPVPEQRVRRQEAHVALVKAFRTRDPEVAAQATRDHLERNVQTALHALSEDPEVVITTHG